MSRDHGAEFIKRVFVLRQFNFDHQVRQNRGEFFLFHRELEFAARLENFITLIGFANLGFNVQKTVTNLHIGFIGLLGKNVGFFRHHAHFVKRRFRIPHFGLQRLNDALTKHAKFSARCQFFSVFSRNSGVFSIGIGHDRLLYFSHVEYG